MKIKMNKNLIIAFLIGVIITLLVVNYLPKFDIKIEMAEKSEPVKIDKTQKDDSFLNETTEIINNTIAKNETEPLAELKVKEEKVSPIDKYLPNKDKYKDLENSQYSYIKPVEVEERTDPFDMPDRPKAIKEPDIPLIDVPTAKRPDIDMNTKSVLTPALGEFEIGAYSPHRDGDVLPIVKVPPQYPRRASQRGIEGWVLLEFTVTETGAVLNPIVIDANPPGIFNRSAIRMINKWKYKPLIKKSKAVQRKGVQHLIAYQLEKKD